MTLANAPDVLRVQEVADLLRVDRKTVYEAIRAGHLHAVSLGRSIRVPKQSLVAFLGITAANGVDQTGGEHDDGS